MTKGKSKGSNFERVICKQLSEWWTSGNRQDIFWRTASSGAMSTQRSKTGKKAFGQTGDIQAIDPLGQPLIDLCNIELKRGYSSATISDFIDSKAKKSQLQKFIEQAITDCRIRDDESEWILIVKRDYKEVILFTSFRFFHRIPKPVNKLPYKFEHIVIRTKVYKRWKTIMVMTLDTFFQQIKPSDIIKLWKMRTKKMRN